MSGELIDGPRISSEDARKKLYELGAIEEGNFKLASGRQSKIRINIPETLYPDTELTLQFANELAMNFLWEGVDVVIGPDSGGIILAWAVAHQLVRNTKRPIKAFHGEKSEEFCLKNEFLCYLREGDLPRNVLVVDDVLTTGGSVRKLVGAILGAGGNVVGVAAIWNRCQVGTDQLGDVPVIYSLINETLDDWPGSSEPCSTNQQIVVDEIGQPFSVAR